MGSLNHMIVLFLIFKEIFGSPAGKVSACSARDPSSIPESRRSAREGIGCPLQYSWASLVAQMVNNLPAMWEILSWEDSPGGGMATHSNILAWRIPLDREAWWAKVHEVTKSQTRLRD